MSDWKTVPLASLVENLDSRRVPVKRSERQSGLYPYYGASGIVDWVGSYLFDGEHLLVAEDGENLNSRSVPIAFRATGKFWVNNHAHILKGPTHLLRYLEHFLNNLDVAGWVTGSAQPKLTQGNLNSIPIYLPTDDDELKAIARVLGALDDKIELNRRMNRTLEELAAALFRSWFVDFDPVVAKATGRKPPHLRPELAALFPAHWQDSELGEIPKGWRVAKLSAVASVNSRKLPRNYPHAEIEYLDISSFSEGVINGTTRLARTSAPSRAQRLVVHGDTIWSCVRPNRRSFALIQDPPENMVVSTGFATLTPTCESAAFIYTATTTEDFTDYLTAHAEGSAYPAVRPDAFENAPLVIPPPDVLKEFEKIVAPWLAQVAHNVRESRTLAALRDTLLPKLLSGELRVKPAEKLVEAHT